MTSRSNSRPPRIRVLRVIARMNVGGPALQVTALTEGLDTERFEQRLLVGDVDEGEADYLELRAPDLMTKRVAGLGRSPNPVADLRALATIRREIRSFRPHIVHTHTAKAGVLGRSAAMLAGSRTRVHTFHGHLLHGYFSPATTKAVVVTERAYARRTTKLVAVGKRVRDELLAAGIGRPEQFTVVPPGVDLPPPPPRAEARIRFGIPLDVPVVAFVARLTQVKRPDRLAEAAHILAADHPSVYFLIAGEGDLLEALRYQVSALGDHVRFVGWRGDVEAIYAASDVVALTSDNEGMPLSLIEAASIGCPAVATRVGSVDEVVVDGSTGFVVDLNAHAIAGKLGRIVDDPALAKRLGSEAAKYAQEHFSRARLVADTARLYEALTTLPVAA